VLTDEQRTQARANIGSLGYNWHTIYENGSTSIQFANYNENSSISNWENGLNVSSTNGTYGSALGEFLNSVYYILRSGTVADVWVKLFVNAGKALIDAGVLVEDSTYIFACITSAQNKQVPEKIAFASVRHRSSRKQWQIADAAEWRINRVATINDDYTIDISTLATVDKTLTLSDYPADAKTVGDALALKADKTEVVLKNEVEEVDAIELAAKMGLVLPVAADDGSIYTDENGCVYSL
jgi:hypothetical protein